MTKLSIEIMSTGKISVEKTIVLYSEQGLSSRKVDLEWSGNKKNMLLFMVLVTFFEGERNAIKCTSFFPAGQALLTVLLAAGSLEPSAGSIPRADFGESRGGGALPALAVLGIHLPWNAGPGAGSHPQEQTDTTAAAFLWHSRVLESGVFSYKTFKLLRRGFL